MTIDVKISYCTLDSKKFVVWHWTLNLKKKLESGTRPLDQHFPNFLSFIPLLVNFSFIDLKLI